MKVRQDWNLIAPTEEAIGESVKQEDYGIILGAALDVVKLGRLQNRRVTSHIRDTSMSKMKLRVNISLEVMEFDGK